MMKLLSCSFELESYCPAVRTTDNTDFSNKRFLAAPCNVLETGREPNFQPHHERSTGQEKVEKQHQVPFQLHINLGMLECIYLVFAMLIEIPYMAAY